MPEAGGANIEIAKHLSEHEAAGESLGQAILEIVEALVLRSRYCHCLERLSSRPLDRTPVRTIRSGEQIACASRGNCHIR